jgi:hypothetical protein
MAASSDGDQPATPPQPRRESQAPRSWGGRGRGRDQGRLTLLGALRGDGVLIWTGGSLPVAYELDVFGRGPVRTASGTLAGDFAALVPPDDAEAPDVPDARLRLSDGRELDIDLTSLETNDADFEARGGSAPADLLPDPKT